MLKFKTSENLLIILGEFMEYSLHLLRKIERSQLVTGWTWKN